MVVVGLDVDPLAVAEAVVWLPVPSSLSSSSLVQLPLSPWTLLLLLLLLLLSLSLSLLSSPSLSLPLPQLADELLLSESESDSFRASPSQWSMAS